MSPSNDDYRLVSSSILPPINIFPPPYTLTTGVNPTPNVFVPVKEEEFEQMSNLEHIWFWSEVSVSGVQELHLKCRMCHIEVILRSNEASALQYTLKWDICDCSIKQDAC